VYAFARMLPQQWVVVLINTQSTPVTMDVDVTGVAPTETVFAGVWHGGRHTVKGQRLHGVTVPARDALVLVNAGSEA
jgi:hypothetical protein